MYLKLALPLFNHFKTKNASKGGYYHKATFLHKLRDRERLALFLVSLSRNYLISAAILGNTLFILIEVEGLGGGGWGEA